MKKSIRFLGGIAGTFFAATLSSCYTGPDAIHAPVGGSYGNQQNPHMGALPPNKSSSSGIGYFPGASGNQGGAPAPNPWGMGKLPGLGGQPAGGGGPVDPSKMGSLPGLGGQPVGGGGPANPATIGNIR